MVGAAVLCEDKAVFIPKIFELNDLSQAVLKGLVEQVMGRAVDLDGDAEGDAEGETRKAGHHSAAGAEEGVEDLKLSATLSEKEQLR